MLMKQQTKEKLKPLVFKQVKHIFKPVDTSLRRKYKELTPKEIKSTSKPRTLNEIQTIQNFIKTTNARTELEQTYYREMKKNKEFNDFFNELKTQNQGRWKSIVNAMDIDTDLLERETLQAQADRLRVIEEQTKRRQFQSTFDQYNKVRDQEFLAKGDPYNYKGYNHKVDTGELPGEGDKEYLDYLNPDPEDGETFDPSKFHLIFLDAGLICNVTTLTRVYQRRVLLFLGNEEGMISHGIGQGPLYPDAFKNAYIELKRNLILIEWDPMNTFPHTVRTRFNDFRLRIKDARRPRWFGSPLMLVMLKYSGLHEMKFEIISRQKDPYAMTFAFFRALTMNTTQSLLAEENGLKQTDIFSARMRPDKAYYRSLY